MGQYQVMEVFPPEAPSLQERTLRLRQQILTEQQRRCALDETVARDSAGPLQQMFAIEDVLTASYREVERQISELRIWQMEADLTALLDIQGD